MTATFIFAAVATQILPAGRFDKNTSSALTVTLGMNILISASSYFKTCGLHSKENQNYSLIENVKLNG
jgi:uncharacterized ion transporter superfamily protein YfcC